MCIQQTDREASLSLAAGLPSDYRRIRQGSSAARQEKLAALAVNSNGFSVVWDVVESSGLAGQMPVAAGMMLNLNYKLEFIELGCRHWWPSNDHEIAATEPEPVVFEQGQPAPPLFSVPPEYALLVIDLA